MTLRPSRAEVVLDRLLREAWQQGGARHTTRSTTIREPASSSAQQQLPSDSSPSSQREIALHDRISLRSDRFGTHCVQDVKEAALFLLLSDNCSVMDFVIWAMAERRKVTHSPQLVARNQIWKYGLFQDSSLAPDLHSVSTTASLPSSGGETDLGADTDLFLTTPGLENARFNSSPIMVGCYKEEEPGPTTARNSVSGAGTSSSSGPATCPSSSKCKGPPMTATAFSSRATRGSTRRVPELENVTVCPDCNRKGQSIFDPNNSGPQGVVWQYFYCRNNDCVRGRSSSRYIGWAPRPK